MFQKFSIKFFSRFSLQSVKWINSRKLRFNKLEQLVPYLWHKNGEREKKNLHKRGDKKSKLLPKMPDAIYNYYDTDIHFSKIYSLFSQIYPGESISLYHGTHSHCGFFFLCPPSFVISVIIITSFVCLFSFFIWAILLVLFFYHFVNCPHSPETVWNVNISTRHVHFFRGWIFK